MELTDEIRIGAPRDTVYAALNDPEILKECIPGCQELIKHSDTDLEAKVQLKIGPVKATFGGKVTLDTANAPSGFSLTGEGSGGPAGYAKGGADVELLEEGNETVLRYQAKADIGGKIAQLGSRLIDSTAKRLAGQFFAKFSEQVSAMQSAPAEPAPAAVEQASAADAAPAAPATVEAAQAEVPKTEVPKTEAPKTETPKPEAAKSEAAEESSGKSRALIIGLAVVAAAIVAYALAG